MSITYKGRQKVKEILKYVNFRINVVALVTVKYGNFRITVVALVTVND